MTKKNIPFEQWHPDAQRQCGAWLDLTPTYCGMCMRCRVASIPPPSEAPHDMTTERSKQRIPTILARLECAAVALSKASSPDDAPPPAVSAEWYSQDVRFLLAELDAALAREATLREALEQLVHAIEAHQAHAWATSDIDTAAARAALAAGEDTHD